jgi:selenocysteine-specific elongation factor
MSEQPPRDVILGTAGHIDHGKTALVEALTGINTDRLPDEQRTGMTIDLGFAHLDLGATRIGVVDVPGHERFIRNMVAGATGVDLALLVIAADDSVMPQTLEHLETLELLGVTEGVIALTKVDLVSGAQRQKATEEIREWMADTAFAEAAIVPVSSVTGEGLEALKETLTPLVEAACCKAAGAVFRLPVDRVFTISGAGTVVTGSVTAGSVRLGDTVEVVPLQRRVRVRGIERHDAPETEAHAGQRAALNLAGIDYREVERSHELSAPGYLEPTTTFDAWIRCLPSAPQAFRLQSSAHLCLGTGDTLARLVPFETDELKPGQSGLAQLHTDDPVVADHGQRFILRSAATGRVVGGGQVLRPVSRKRRRSDPVRNRALHVLAEGDERARVLETLRLADATPQPPLTVCRNAGVSPQRLAELLADLEAAGEVVSLGVGGQEVRLPAATLAELEELCRRVASDFHRAHPLEPGIPEAQMSSRISRRVPEWLWPALRDRLLQSDKLKRVGDRLALPDFHLELAPEIQRLKDSFHRQIREGWFSPPAGDDLSVPPGTKPEDCRALLELLQLEGSLVKVAPELWLDAAAVTQAKERIAAEVARTGPLSVAQIRDVLQTSRRYAVPLCEYLDRIRFTRRVGDQRALVSDSVSGASATQQGAGAESAPGTRPNHE